MKQEYGDTQRKESCEKVKETATIIGGVTTILAGLSAVVAITAKIIGEWKPK